MKRLAGALVCVIVALLAAVALAGDKDNDLAPPSVVAQSDAAGKGSPVDTAADASPADSAGALLADALAEAAQGHAQAPRTQLASAKNDASRSPGSSRGPEPDSSPGESLPEHEALPCTSPKEPTNFEVFSAGSEPVGLPLTGTVRRCDVRVPAGEWPANYVSYSYGTCEIPENATGCQPPLVVQTWPACQRSLVDYSWEGKPMPYRELPSHEGAQVVEIAFPLESRIEVYTKSATIVIFASDPNVARETVGLLRPLEQGTPPATTTEDIGGEPSVGLAPPSDGSTKGTLRCHS